ncbi:MAG: class I adenylate-forming enzyme family protein [bacterium]|nr:class I adenylate-forming enzyme family protein [bacterium]
MNSLYEHIVRHARTHPDKVALLSCDEAGNTLESITYRELLAKVAAAAAGLAGLGLHSGDRVALLFENSPELLVVSWAAWCSGITTVPLDTKRDTEELCAYKVSLSKARTTLTQEDVRTWVGTPVSYMSGLSHEALILFTSGTTARPKGAQLSLNNLVVNARGIVEWLRIIPSDRFLVQLPLHHINSTTFCLAALLAGASIAIPPRYSSSRFWEQAAKTGATLTSVVQSIIFDQLQRKDEYAAVRDRLKLSRIQIGSAPVVAASVQAFIQQFSIPLYQGYGQTETALRVTGVPMDLSKSVYDEMVEENSIGTPMNWVTVEIMGPRQGDEASDEAGKLLGEGEDGELIVKGPAVMQGYLGGEPAFRDGYFLTGDIGYYRVVEGRRFFFLRGRKSEMIIKGGINISPLAVENSLQKISQDLDQAYVVGVEDDRYGEEVGAVLCLKQGTDEARAIRRLKFLLLVVTPHLRPYEMPKFLRFAQPAELPMTSTGKVQRTMLKKFPREQWESVYNLLETPHYRFVVVDPQSPFVAASHALHNHCWQPLTLDAHSYRKKLAKEMTLVAVDAQGALAGQISFTHDKDALTCVSICSATYTYKPAPRVDHVPTAEEVQEYVLAGHDPVINFHTKLGATFVKVTSQGRPEDNSALGYTVLLEYPPAAHATLTPDAPISVQLIEAVRLLAADLDLKVFALSRPGGLAAYLLATKKEP